jgi:hypothetical protein
MTAYGKTLEKGKREILSDSSSYSLEKYYKKFLEVVESEVVYLFRGGNGICFPFRH